MSTRASVAGLFLGGVALFSVFPQRVNGSSIISFASGSISEEAELTHYDDDRSIDSGVYNDKVIGGAGSTARVQGSITGPSPLRFKALANANAAPNSHIVAHASFSFSDYIHLTGNQSIILQIASDPHNYHIFVIENLTGSLNGDAGVILTIDTNEPGHIPLSLTALGQLTFNLSENEIEKLTTAGGLLMLNGLVVEATGDGSVFGGAASSTANFSDTADAMYFYLTDLNNHPIDGVKFVDDDGIEYPVNQPLPTPEPAGVCAALVCLSMLRRHRK